MARFSDLLSDDTNQFGPGTDLALSVLALMLVIGLITSHLYDSERNRRRQADEKAARATAQAGTLEKELTEARAAARAKSDEAARLAAREEGGNFKLSSEFFTAADFHARPVTALVDRRGTTARAEGIVDEYRRSSGEYPYIFVIGHSSTLDDPDARDRSIAARRRRNMEYALRRAALIAGLLQESLDHEEIERLVVASTGEFDLKDALHPESQENAFVEVVFGREWKLPPR